MLTLIPTNSRAAIALTRVIYGLIRKIGLGSMNGKRTEPKVSREILPVKCTLEVRVATHSSLPSLTHLLRSRLIIILRSSNVELLTNSALNYWSKLAVDEMILRLWKRLREDVEIGAIVV